MALAADNMSDQTTAMAATSVTIEAVMSGEDSPGSDIPF
jgi:hypothetical protein